MSLALDTAYRGAGFFFFQIFSNLRSNLRILTDIFLTDTPMHSFMGGITVHTAPPPHFALHRFLLIVCSLLKKIFLVVVAWLEVK